MPKRGKSFIQDRINRAQGQINAVETMIVDGGELRKVINQLQAAISSLESIKLELIKKKVKDNIEVEISSVLDMLK